MFNFKQISPIRPMLRVWVEVKLVRFLQATSRFGVKVVPPRMTHGMSKCMGPNPSLKALGLHLMISKCTIGMKFQSSIWTQVRSGP